MPSTRVHTTHDPAAAMESLKNDAGQMLTIGFDGGTLPTGVDESLRAGRIGGVILFRRNVETPAQVAALNAEVFRAAEEGGNPLPFVAVDQEGGRVQRVREPLLRVPPMSRVGEADDPDLTAKLGEAMGDELGTLGFNLNFAPCADLRTNPANEVIGDRSFGADPERVARHAGALALGLTISGVVPCAKHFPGHGDTLADSHFELPRLDLPIDTLRHREIRVFERLIGAGIPMIMTAHILIPAIDTHHPITLSEQGVGQLLRRRLRFGGVIVSDDLEMAAVADRYSVEEAVTRGLRAGVDLLLICHSEERWTLAWETLVRLGEQSSADRELIAMAAGRIRHLKERWLRPWQVDDDAIASFPIAAHAALRDAILARSEAVS